jgi:hypothetical protein
MFFEHTHLPLFSCSQLNYAFQIDMSHNNNLDKINNSNDNNDKNSNHNWGMNVE